MGFIEKDLRNAVYKLQRNVLRVGDACGTLAYLDGRAKSDPNFFYKYAVDKKNRLKRIFLSNAQSRLDYQYFGDILAFDSTYCTNTYKKPLVLLVGVNHHFVTMIFGYAVIADETEDMYKWVLESFLEAMNMKIPISVATDGDSAMKNAINMTIPFAHHQLCSWHLKRNVGINKNKDFLRDFTIAMEMTCSVEEFEKRWQLIIEKHNLIDNPWIAELYKKRKK